MPFFQLLRKGRRWLTSILSDDVPEPCPVVGYQSAEDYSWSGIPRSPRAFECSMLLALIAAISTRVTKFLEKLNFAIWFNQEGHFAGNLPAFSSKL